MRLLAIDPGKTGAAAILEDNKVITLLDMKTVKMGSKTMVDSVWVASLLHDYSIDVMIIEQVGASPKMGVSSAFNFGYSFGVVIGAASGAQVEWHTITPNYWKTYFGLLKKDKDDARLKVLELYPHLKEELKYKNSVDKADAVLLGLAWLGGKKK